MDEQQRRAEQLLEERMRSHQPKPNGATATEPEGEPSTDDAPPADYKADLQRMAADFANYRKRNEAERTEFAKFAKADLITKLLDVLDGYDRALASVPEDLKGQPGNTWVEGMWLVERKLRQILEGEGLEPVESLGEPFDPYVHEAVAHVESDEPEGTVTQEHQKAYRLHDRVIRPALVSVAKAKNKER
ncbi:MAG TPA: nucleotide exchange factor GrpE [Candidatus Limnocylindria bacterium]|nr:nucleotide exchange factor GrpE [Candidatus Limnocylindria bacterium]